MITGAGEVAVVGGAFLVAIGLAHARVHIEHDAVRWTAAVHTVNPSAVEIGERDKVLIIRKPLRLEASYLAGGGSTVVGRPAARSEERRVGKECRSRWSPY